MKKINNVITVDAGIFLHYFGILGTLAPTPDILIVIPISVYEEIDRYRHNNGKNHRGDEKGHNARELFRTLDLLGEMGSLKNGVQIAHNKGYVLVDHNGNGDDVKKISSDLVDNTDNRIIAIANKWKDKGKNVIILSEDIGVRNKANSFGIKSQGYLKYIHNHNNTIVRSSCAYKLTIEVLNKKNRFIGEPIVRYITKRQFDRLLNGCKKDKRRRRKN